MLILTHVLASMLGMAITVLFFVMCAARANRETDADWRKRWSDVPRPPSDADEDQRFYGPYGPGSGGRVVIPVAPPRELTRDWPAPPPVRDV